MLAFTLDRLDAPASGCAAVQPRRSVPRGRHKLEADRFAKHLATELAQRFDWRLFKRLVLIAPPELMGMLRKELPKRVEATIAEEITEDLSRLPRRAHRALPLVSALNAGPQFLDGWPAPPPTSPEGRRPRLRDAQRTP